MVYLAINKEEMRDCYSTPFPFPRKTGQLDPLVASHVSVDRRGFRSAIVIIHTNLYSETNFAATFQARRGVSGVESQ